MPVPLDYSGIFVSVECSAPSSTETSPPQPARSVAGWSRGGGTRAGRRGAVASHRATVGARRGPQRRQRQGDGGPVRGEVRPPVALPGRPGLEEGLDDPCSRVRRPRSRPVSSGDSWASDLVHPASGDIAGAFVHGGNLVRSPSSSTPGSRASALPRRLPGHLTVEVQTVFGSPPHTVRIAD